jgi:hypothetical protein
MGAGASASRELTEEEKAKLQELKAMSPEAQQELAVNAMREVLQASVVFAITKGKVVETWTDPTYAIPCPKIGDFQEVAETVGKIPLVGSGLASAVMSPVGNILTAFNDCACTVFAAPALLEGLTAIIANIDVLTAIQLGQQGGFAYSEYLIQSAADQLSATLTTIIGEILKTHTLTTLWSGTIAAYNKAASKIPGIETLEFDLQDYVLAQTMASLGAMVFEKESSVRSGRVEGMSEAVQKVYGGGQISVEEQIKPIILVNKGDPRTIFFQQPWPTVLDREHVLDPTTVGGTVLTTKGGLVVVQKWSRSKKVGGWSWWNQIGVGQPGQVAADGCVGRPLHFNLYEKCFTTRVGGEGNGRPGSTNDDGTGIDQLFAMDLANGRYFEGNGIGIMSSDTPATKSTLRKNGGRDWTLNEDGSVSPAKSGFGFGSGAGDWVLGCKLVSDGKGFTVGGGKTY